MNKKFDSVEFQREVRRKLSKEYLSDRKEFVRKLREKYGKK